MGITAHPGIISSISVSFDGKYFFSAGGSDLAAYMYEIDLSDKNINKDNNGSNNNHNENSNSNSYNDDDMNNSNNSRRHSVDKVLESQKSFLTLLEGGEGGELHEDIIEYFYFCQLRAQGEDSMNVRTVSGEIPIEEIPSLMRAVGFYPSEGQVLDMLNEVQGPLYFLFPFFFLTFFLFFSPVFLIFFTLTSVVQINAVFLTVFLKCTIFE